MILAFDTYYVGDKAKTVCLSFTQWEDTAGSAIYDEVLCNVAGYTPGEFYRRELPCILSLLKKIPFTAAEAIVVDGFVFLDDERKPGLGAHLYNALEERIPVIGVAKTNFATLHAHKTSLLRGGSARPLYITAIGIDTGLATAYIKKMAGTFRIPALLKQLDSLTREHAV